MSLTVNPRILLYVAVCLLAAMAFVPAAAAHPISKQLAYETRLLHDNTDDHGGHNANSPRTVAGHDLMALDLQERYDLELGRGIDFRLYLNPGAWPTVTTNKSTVKDIFTFKADGVDQSLEWVTTDDKAFTGTFDDIRIERAYKHAVEGGEQVRTEGNEDGARRVVVGFATYDSLGFAPGTKLSDFQVTGYHNTTVEDIMGPDDPAGSEGGYWALPDHTLQGTTHYVDATLDDLNSNDNLLRIEMPVYTTGASTEQGQLDITLTNGYGRIQQINLTFPKLEGFVHNFHDGATFTPGYAEFDLARNNDGEMLVHLYAFATKPGTQTGLLEMRTSLGGYENWTVTLVGTKSSQDDGTTDDAAADDQPDGDDATDTNQDDGAGTGDDDALDTGDGQTDGNGSGERAPAPAAAFMVAAIFGLAAWARRRG